MSRIQRILVIFYRLLNSEKISVRVIANKFHLSPKTVYRDIQEIKCFFYDYFPDGSITLNYSYSDRCFMIHIENKLEK